MAKKKKGRNISVFLGPSAQADLEFIRNTIRVGLPDGMKCGISQAVQVALVNYAKMLRTYGDLQTHELQTNGNGAT